MAKKNVLLLEGTDDKHVVMHLCTHYGLPQIDEIAEHGGIDKLIESFPVRLKESDVATIAVLIDADTNIQARWESLRQHLSAASYLSVPAAPSPQGTILAAPRGALLPRVGIWLMPDNQHSGMLEDFLRFLVPTPNPLLEHVRQSIDSIPASLRRFAAKEEPKALIHTWLAWQKDPGKPYGTAITARYLDADVPQAKLFIGWLRKLFFP
jgi:hypothetical protein